MRRLSDGVLVVWITGVGAVYGFPRHRPFLFPTLLDFEHAIPKQGVDLAPFHLGPIRYATQRSDVHGIAWVMNHAASYVLVSIGLVDLLAARWLTTTETGSIMAAWIAGWWVLRAASQRYLGARRGDWLIMCGFGLLAIVHLGAALQ